MELRSEESLDIQPYTHNRLVEKVVVSLGDDIARIKASYLRVCKLYRKGFTFSSSVLIKIAVSVSKQLSYM